MTRQASVAVVAGLLCSAVASAQETPPVEPTAVTEPVAPVVASPPPSPPAPPLAPAPVATDDGRVDELEAKLRRAQQQIDLLTDAGDELAPLSALESVPKVEPIGFLAVRVVGSTGETPLAMDVSEVLLGARAELGRGTLAEVSFGFNGLEMPVQLDVAALDMELTEHMSLQVGRLYVPIGYWNTHHPAGDLSAVSAERPQAIATSGTGAFVPQHVGLDLAGAYVLGSWQVGWHLGVGDGRGSAWLISEAAPSWDKNTWAQLWVQTPAGLQLGWSGSMERVEVPTNDGLGGFDSAQASDLVQAVHVAWLRRRTELLVEGFVVLHKLEGADSAVYSRSGFAQWSHRARWGAPYTRVELLERWQDDPIYMIFGGTRSYGAATAGVRKDLSAQTAVRFELGLEREVLYADGVLATRSEPSATDALFGGLHFTAGF